MSTPVVNNIQELQQYIGRQKRAVQRQSFIDRFHIADDVSSIYDEGQNLIDGGSTYAQYLDNFKVGHGEPLEKWEWQLLYGSDDECPPV